MVKLVDVEGQPLRGVWATGLREKEWPIQVNSELCPVYALEPGKPRFMVFYERGRKLAGTLTLTGNEKEPTMAKLAPAGAIRGRLLDSNGKPLAEVVVDVHYRDEAARRIHEIVHAAKKAVTDAEGTFSLDELIPELKFELNFRQGKRRYEPQTKTSDTAVQLKTRECRELGAIRLKWIAE